MWEDWLTKCRFFYESDTTAYLNFLNIYLKLWRSRIRYSTHPYYSFVFFWGPILEFARGSFPSTFPRLSNETPPTAYSTSHRHLTASHRSSSEKYEWYLPFDITPHLFPLPRFITLVTDRILKISFIYSIKERRSLRTIMKSYRSVDYLILQSYSKSK